MLKNIAFLLLLTGGLAACGNEVKQDDTADVEVTHDHSTDNKVASLVKDPICDMEKEATWTDFALSPQGDTVWFCSPTCKDAYAAKTK